MRSRSVGCVSWIGIALLLAACSGVGRGVYYDTMERFGKQKRHILTQRVEASREDQQEAQEQFLTTFELFQQATGFRGGNLEDFYRRLDGEYESSVEKADDVRGRIASIEQVAGDLFSEWEGEIGEISSADLRAKSQAQLRDTRARYAQMIGAMKRAEAKMDPVLTAFRDQVLFLKHNLNAAAIASLQDNVVSISDDVDALIAEMQRAIHEAEAFVASMQG